MFWSHQTKAHTRLTGKPQWCDDLKYNAMARKITKKEVKDLSPIEFSIVATIRGASIVKDHNATIYMPKGSRHTKPRCPNSTAIKLTLT
jgi:hypothetical protein